MSERAAEETIEDIVAARVIEALSEYADLARHREEYMGARGKETTADGRERNVWGLVRYELDARIAEWTNRGDAMSETVPVEVTTRYATTVDDLSAAWAFVMDKLEKVGPDPSVTISPHWVVSVHDMDDAPGTEYPRKFSVVVSGMVHEPTTPATGKRA